jgi:histidinol-phosphate aminotransferase
MFELNKVVRPNILALKPYSSARDEYKGEEGIFLDANENPFGDLNRYPDPYQKKLKEKISSIKNVSTENIFVGNGSDEVIDIAYRTFCEPGKDKALTFSPTYGMYDVSAAINNVELLKIPLTNVFQIDFDALETSLEDDAIKIIFICSPNNPTANNLINIEKIIEKFKGIVFIDEAYIDFSNAISFNTKLALYSNVIVSQTFSKAWGLAAARVGVAYASKEIINIFNKVKPPYNVSLLSQNAALETLSNVQVFEKNKQAILQQREILLQAFGKIKSIEKTYPTNANFILIQVSNADVVYNLLVAEKIITRNRNSVIKNCIRITVGSDVENKKLLNCINAISIT